MTTLEERTLVVRNIDGDELSVDLLEELFRNFGPLRHIVLRKTFAFIEYTKKDAVAYAWAMMEGIFLKGRQLRVQPKLIDDPEYHGYRDRLQDYEHNLATDKEFFDSLLNDEQKEAKKHLISALQLRSSSTTASSARRRFRRYLRHYESRSTFNHIHVLGKDLSSDDQHHDRRHDRDRQKDSAISSNNHGRRRHRGSHKSTLPDLRDALRKANQTRHHSSNRRSSNRDERRSHDTHGDGHRRGLNHRRSHR